ncbi:MAG TPA: response regulator [Vicinamibacterales bacterium]|nr:response regulator [Vicinamibacterales bacterium]
MTTILVIDDDPWADETLLPALRHAGHRVLHTTSVRQGRQMATQHQPDLALTEMTLPDGDGLTILRSARQFTPYTRVVVVTRAGTVRSAVQAMQLGAIDLFEKPVPVGELLRFIGRLRLGPRQPVRANLPDPERHAAKRWVEMVSRTVNLPEDPRTVADWARATGISAGAIRGWCRAAHLPVKPSLNFARMLRAVLRCDGLVPVADLLNIVDTRTLVRFLRLGDPASNPCQLPMPLDDYLARQRWIVDPAVVRGVRDAVRTAGPGIRGPAPSPTRCA